MHTHERRTHDGAIINDLSPGSRYAAVLTATRLRNTLRLNAAFSAATGLVGLVAATPLTGLLGLGVDTTTLLRVLGLGLLVFALDLLWLARRPTSRLLTESIVVIAADLLWVAASLALIVTGFFSPGGAALVGVLAAVVAVFAQRQHHHRRRTAGVTVTDGRDTSEPPAEAVLFERDVAVAAEELWPVMTDHELYAELAGNLGSARAITVNGPDLVRRCTDSRGRGWQETCTLWDEGRRFAIEVQTDAEDYPYPLSQLQGSWAVEPVSAARSRITMAFLVRPEPGLAGAAMTTGMHLAFGPILHRIVRGWVRAASSAR